MPIARFLRGRRPQRVFVWSILALSASAPGSARGVAAAPVEPPCEHSLLLIQSYDQLMSWGIALQQGVVDTLDVDGARVRLAVENLDSKLHNTPEYFDACRRLLAVKYADMRFDLVLTADNNAFNFVKQHREELFPGTPVVFGGLNGFTPAMLDGYGGVTGVAEVYSARETIELALRLFPRTREVYVLNDGLVTGRAAAADIEAQLADLRPGLRVVHAPVAGLAEQKEHLADLPPDAIVLLGVYYADRDGVHSTFEDMGRELASASARPVFCVLEFNVGGGCLGGRVVSGYWQGVSMARQGRRVLHGADPAALPVVAEAANRFIFDHAQLARWGIDEDRLPAGAIVRNRPFSVWRAYRLQIIGVAVFMVLLLGTAGGMAVNIRRRHETEGRLRRSEESLSVTLASIGDAVVATDREGRIVRMNPQAVRITGWQEEDARGRLLAEVMPVVDLESGEPLPDLSARVLAAGRTVEAIRRGLLVTRDGAETVIEDSGAPIFRAEGTMIGVVLVFRDVTAKAELEDRLRHSQKLEAVGQLAGGVAHDFNNMLAGIMGYAEMTRDEDLSSEERNEFLGHILTAASRAADLTRKLLAFSRKGKVLSTPVDVHAVVRETEALLARSVDRRVELDLDLAAPNCSVIGDPTQIQQAVLNLGLNARDAMPDGGRLRISTANRWMDEAACAAVASELTPGDYLVLAVSDTGRGIPADVMPRIFEPFFTTKPVGEGTGLGLAAVRGTVEDHFGAVSVRSTPGVGTTFEVLLPLSGLQPAEQEAQEIHPVPRAGTLLVVDDEAVLRGMVQRMLSGLGWKVLTAADGVEGLEQFRLHGPAIDAVLLDMVMPRMDGRECFRAIRALDPEAVVILASGFAPDHAVADLMNEGLAAFLKKPYRQADLLNALSRLAGRKEA